MFGSFPQFGRMYGCPLPGPVSQSSSFSWMPVVTHGPKAPDEDDEDEDDDVDDEDEVDDELLDTAPLLLDDEDDVPSSSSPSPEVFAPPELDESAAPESGMSSKETRSEQPAAAIVTAMPRAS